jgi:hypothetical protein
MPELSGIDMLDVKQMRDWSTAVNAGVRVSEEHAARVFLPIARACL